MPSGNSSATEPAAPSRRRSPRCWSGWRRRPRRRRCACHGSSCLAFVGRFDEARAELALAAAGDAAPKPEVAFELASLEQYIDCIERGTTGVSAMREVTERLPVDSVVRLQAEVTLAIAAARPLAQQAYGDWTAPLVAVRARLGWTPWRATLRDTWWPIWILFLFLGLLVSLAASVLRTLL